MDSLYTVFHFLLAIGILVSIHEFGHFLIARLAGVKVLRFSIGFGKVICAYQKTINSTEYVLSAIPLGGYVKMVDEREGTVKEEDLPYAFNRQSLFARSAIVLAGPVFNLLLAVFLFWGVFMIGETGMRPIVGTVESGTLAAEAGFIEGEEILSINDKATPTWAEAITTLFSFATQGQQEMIVRVKNKADIEQIHLLRITAEDVQQAETLYARLGLKPWEPELKPIIAKVLENSAAQAAGLQQDDLIMTADNEPIAHWNHWVEYVKNRPEIPIALIIERDGVHIPITILPARVKNETKDFGRIGASVYIPEELINALRVEFSLTPLDALIASVEKTWFFSTSTLRMMGQMLIGKASVKNIGGPLSIAKYARKSADMGLVPFLKFLAVISISLGVLNLLPIPVLDGGHLMFLFIESIKGSPVSERIQLYFQQIGILLLILLMVFAIFLDIERLFQ